MLLQFPRSILLHLLIVEILMETTIAKAKKIVTPVLTTEDARIQILKACDRDGLHETFMHLVDVLVLMHPYQLCSAVTGMGLGKYLPKHMETMLNASRS